MNNHLNMLSCHQVWAFGKFGLKYLDESLLTLLLTRATSRSILPALTSTGVNVANICWALAKLGYENNPEFLDMIADSVISFLESPASDEELFDNRTWGKVEGAGRTSYQTKELINIIWAYATLDRYKPRLWEAVCVKLLPLVPFFNGQDVSSSLWAMANVGHIDDTVLASIFFKLKLQIHYLKTAEISMIVCCLPKLEAAIWSSSKDQMPQSDRKKMASAGQEASQLLLREMRDRMMQCDSKEIKLTGNNLSSHYLDFGPAEISFAIWMAVLEKNVDEDDQKRTRTSCSLSNSELDEFLNWLMVTASNNIDKFSHQELTNLFWSCAKSSLLTPPKLVDETVAALLPTLYLAYGTINLAKLFWSLARLGFKPDSEVHQAFLVELTSVASPLLPVFGFQDLANTLWAMSMFRLAGTQSASKHHLPMPFIRDLIECIKTLTRNSPSSCDLRELSSNALSMGRLHDLIYDYELMELIANESVVRVNSLGGQEMGNLCWGMAKCRHKNDSLMDAVGQKIIESKGRGLRTQEASNIACAFSSLGLSSKWREVYRHLGPNLTGSFNTQDLANLSHAHATAGIYEPWLMDRLLAIVGKDWDTQSNKMFLEMTQVLAYLLTTEEEGLIENAASLSALTSDPRYIKLKKMATRVYQLQANKDGSFIQKSVFKAINTTSKILSGQFEGKCFLEFMTSDNLFSIDIAIPSKKIAIEVDGPSHFLNSHPEEYEGTTALRNRLLKNRGWKVASFSLCKWKFEKWDTGVQMSQEGCDALSALIAKALLDDKRTDLDPDQPSVALDPDQPSVLSDDSSPVEKIKRVQASVSRSKDDGEASQVTTVRDEEESDSKGERRPLLIPPRVAGAMAGTKDPYPDSPSDLGDPLPVKLDAHSLVNQEMAAFKRDCDCLIKAGYEMEDEARREMIQNMAALKARFGGSSTSQLQGLSIKNQRPVEKKTPRAPRTPKTPLTLKTPRTLKSPRTRASTALDTEADLAASASKN